MTKTIAGSAAGQQGAVTITSPAPTGSSQDIVIPAGTTGDTSQTFDGLPAGTECTLTETADGSSSTVVVTVTGLGAATVTAGSVAITHVTDTYQSPAAPEAAPIPPGMANTSLPSTGAPVAGTVGWHYCSSCSAPPRPGSPPAAARIAE